MKTNKQKKLPRHCHCETKKVQKSLGSVNGDSLLTLSKALIF